MLQKREDPRRWMAHAKKTVDFENTGKPSKITEKQVTIMARLI